MSQAVAQDDYSQGSNTISRRDHGQDITTEASADLQGFFETSSQLRHDMSNILCSINMQLFMLKRKQLLKNEQFATLEYCTGRLQALINHWKRLETDVEGQSLDVVELFDLSKLVAQTLDTYQPIIRHKDQQLVFRIGDGDMQVLGARIHYERLLGNLISNACKYTSNGGTVEIEIRRRKVLIQISVIDNGIGIPQQELAHIFDCRYRASTVRQSKIAGDGLGLSIVKKIVDDLGGDISVQSQIDSGSAFIVSLPMSR